MLLRRSLLCLYRVLDGTFAPAHARLLTTHTPVTVGIRREDPQRIWERRTPLSPKDVKELVESGVNVEIEHCDRRIFRDEEYTAVGAKLASNLSNAHIIIGIKETPLDEVLIDGIAPPSGSHWHQKPHHKIPRTHLMFSHTTKGQPYNTPLLAKYIAREDTSDSALRPRLIDYELLTDESGVRTVGFGWFKGVAGTLESLSSMAQSHLENGIATPFLSTPRPHTHPTLQSIRDALRAVGERIKQGGIPPALGPFVIGLTGTGNVAEGCLDILQELPVEKVKVTDLHALVTNPHTPLDKIYLVHVQPQDYLTRFYAQSYSGEDYYARPELYRSTFCETIAPYLTLYLNSTNDYAVPQIPHQSTVKSTNRYFTFPRLMTKPQLSIALYHARARALPGHQFRFTNVGDLSCDIEGDLEFLTRTTTLSDPFYKISPPLLPSGDDPLPQVQIMSVNTLPASLPLDASVHFSREVVPYVRSLVRWYQKGDVASSSSEEREGEGHKAEDGYVLALERATIAREGGLVGKFTWLMDGVREFWKRSEFDEVLARNSTESGSVRSGCEEGRVCKDPTIPILERGVRVMRKVEKRKRILLLGSGAGVRPAVEEITKREDVTLLVAGNSLAELVKLEKEFVNVGYRVIDVDNQRDVGALVEEADVVISLLPAHLYHHVALKCLKYRKHFVTASHVSKARMEALHDHAVDADVILLSNIGLNYGIDHLFALDTISRIQAEGQTIKSFISFCGGLPAPDVAHTPFRYKFSSKPSDVLRTGMVNNSRFMLKGTQHNVPEGQLYKNVFADVPITGEFKLEGLVQHSIRDMWTYMEQPIRTFVRGTLRYPGFSSLMESFRLLGFLNMKEKIYLPNWYSFVRLCIAQQLNIEDPNRTILPDAISRLIPAENIPELQAALEWLDLVPNPFKIHTDPIPPLLPSDPMTPIEIFTYYLAHYLTYKPHERDMVVLSHEVITENPRTYREYVYRSSLITYGTERTSAMERMVGVSSAVAALLVVDGKIALRGTATPLLKGVYTPMASRLEEVGLGMKESQESLGVAGWTKTVESALVRETELRLEELRKAEVEVFEKNALFETNQLDLGEQREGNGAEAETKAEAEAEAERRGGEGH